MSNEVLPELKQIIGALVFGANRSLSVKELRRCIVEVAEKSEGLWAAYADVKEADVRTAAEELHGVLGRDKCGFLLNEVAGGWRFQSDPACGTWLKHLLNIGRPNRLSGPALETLAIVAYRQPVSRIDIEAIRGVNVDHVVRMLMEMQLVRISGRSDLPGKPFLYGTTQKFLEHFGLKSLDDLKDLEPGLLAVRAEAKAKVTRASRSEDGELNLEDGERRPDDGAQAADAGAEEDDEEVLEQDGESDKDEAADGEEALAADGEDGDDDASGEDDAEDDAEEGEEGDEEDGEPDEEDDDEFDGDDELDGDDEDDGDGELDEADEDGEDEKR